MGDITEALDPIFSFLDVIDLLAAASVNREWKQASQSQWKHRLSVWNDGHNDEVMAKERGNDDSAQRLFLENFRAEQKQFWNAQSIATMAEWYRNHRAGRYPSFFRFLKGPRISRQELHNRFGYSLKALEGIRQVVGEIGEYSFFVRVSDKIEYHAVGDTAIAPETCPGRHWNGFVPLLLQKNGSVEKVYRDNGSISAYRLRFDTSKCNLQFDKSIFVTIVAVRGEECIPLLSSSTYFQWTPYMNGSKPCLLLKGLAVNCRAFGRRAEDENRDRLSS